MNDFFKASIVVAAAVYFQYADRFGLPTRPDKAVQEIKTYFTSDDAPCNFYVPDAILKAKIKQYGFRVLKSNEDYNLNQNDECYHLYTYSAKRIVNGVEQDGVYDLRMRFQKYGNNYELTSMYGLISVDGQWKRLSIL